MRIVGCTIMGLYGAFAVLMLFGDELSDPGGVKGRRWRPFPFARPFPAGRVLLRRLRHQAGDRRRVARGVGGCQLRRRLERGRYALSLVVRQLTKTTLTQSAQELTPGASVSFTLGVSPAPDDGTVELQIDRFDVLTGWQFHRTIQVRAPGGVVTWTPPALGRWRARASFLGTLRFSPSESGYVQLLVAKPIG